MSLRQIKTGYFALAALNTLATSYFFNYLFFFLRDHFGFTNRENLWVCALYGFIYIFSAWQCGRFAQRRGFLTSLKLGFGGLTMLMIGGAVFDSLLAVLFILVGYSIVLLFTWPALEALVSEDETQQGVQHMVGVYNCTWAAGAAVAYFTGGQLYDWMNRGTVFVLPAILFFAGYLLTLWLSAQAKTVAVDLQPKLAGQKLHFPEASAYRQRVSPQGFLKMAWLANPFAFVAINTLWAVMPGLAAKLGLSPAQAGLFCSVWLFGRLGAFVFLWQWNAWHYRFRWLLAAFLTLMASFLLMLLSAQLWLVVVAQVFFGLATGLIYYSSLFYSMDVGEAKGEHGGLHEAAIGVGSFAGPAVGAASLQFLPYHTNTGALAVTLLLLLGLGGLLFIWGTQRRR